MNNKRILEALKMQPLSEEEMTARHILGRLYGPIATCVESTRNGRLYNKPLWEKALNDEIFLEKVATKALFLELGHPVDREETDMKQACACIPEVPKIVGDDLYAYVDIIDTPNGRLLKTLVDYGFVPGISSRGSGDVMDNNQVDPETFFLETWDIVQLPAVKKARLESLNMCESLDSDKLKLRKALVESYKAATEDDKNTMKKALENLNINIEEDIEKEATADDVVVEAMLTADDIPWSPDASDVLVEDDAQEDSDSEDTANSENNEEESAVDAENGDTASDVDAENDEPAEDSESDTAEDEPADDDTTSDEPAEEKIVDVNAADEANIDTVGDALELLQEYDDEVKIEFEATLANGEQVPVDKISSSVETRDEEEVLILGVSCDETKDNLDSAEIDIDIVDDEPAVETIEEVDDTAEDTGDAEVIESLKNVIRQKEALEAEVTSLRKAKAVGDAKEQELQERLLQYRDNIDELKDEAAKVPGLQARIKALTEKLTQSKAKIETLTEAAKNARQLKESVEADKVKVSKLNEQITKLTNKADALDAKLEEQTKQYTQKLQERTELAKKYKARFIETLTSYINSKANMLGVPASEITSRLNENYTLADVNAVCDQILDSTVNFSRLPFGGRAKTTARISESVSKHKMGSANSVEYGYEIDDTLLELAGLKN